MDWRAHIHSDPGILGGKPVVRGTRISVELILEWFAAGWREADLLAEYPRLTPEALRAVFAFSRTLVAEQLYSLPSKAA